MELDADFVDGEVALNKISVQVHLLAFSLSSVNGGLQRPSPLALRWWPRSN